MASAPVSVVIPCYRCAETIGRAVASVAAQTLRPAEVILVDDGSADGTLGALEKLAASHAPGWIRVVALPANRGAADARNAGWGAATQPYVAFLDADDAWHPRKIELQLGYMQAHPEVALSGHDYRVVSGDGTPAEESLEEGAALLGRLELLLSNRLVTPSVMLRRALPLRFRAGRRYVDDHLLWLQIQRAGHPVARLRARLALVYKPMYGEGGLSSRLWAMESAELENYRILRREGSLGSVAALALSAWSLAKYLRRVLLVALRGGRRRAAIE